MSASLAKQQSSSEHAGLNLSFLAEKTLQNCIVLEASCNVV